MKKKLLALFIAIGLVTGLSGCAEQIELAGLALADAPLTMAPGQSAAIEPAPSFSKEAPTEEEIAAVLEQITLVWSSSDETVATVEDGTVTAHAPGNAVITVADSEGRYSATVGVTVVVPVERATAPDSITLDLLADETAKLDVTVLPANATDVEISYSSGGEAVVTVDAAGNLTPVAEGEAVITTTIAGDGLDGRTERTLTTTITVALLPQGIALESTEGLLYVGYSHQLTPYTLPEEAPDSTYTYTVSDPAIASVDENGSIKALSPGTAAITITSGEGYTAIYALTVTAAPRSGGNSGGGSSGNVNGAGGGTAGGDTGEAGGEDAGGEDGGAGGGSGDPGGGSGGGNPYATPPNPDGDGSPGNPIDGGSGVGDGAPGFGF